MASLRSNMKNISVIGAGLMGHALALVYVLGGHRVRITDSKQEVLEDSKEMMAGALDLLVENHEVESGWNREKLFNSIRWCSTLEETLEDVELVVEAIVESLDAKKILYEKIDKLIDEDCVIASNTSELDIFPVIPEKRQENSLIMHWYSPPYLCDLVDIAAGPITKSELVKEMTEMVRAMGKEPVVFKKFIPGYVANRVQSAINLELFDLLDHGLVTPEDIDRSLIHGLALRLPILGMMAKNDFAGLPLLQEIYSNRSYTPPIVRGKCETLDRLIDEGRKGVMNGKGFYDWGNKSPDDLFRERNTKLLKLKKLLREIKPMGIEKN